MKSRIFNIMQYELHPDTKEPLLNEETIKIALAHKTILRYAYVAHTEDVYSEKDFINDSSKVEGHKKPKHWHIVIEMKVQAEIDTIAKWFGIPSNYVEIAKGHGAFMDCVEYLTHENPNQQALGKHLYKDEEVKANFNFRDELSKRQERKLKYGKDLNDKDTMLLQVLQEGKTLLQCQEENALLYAENLDKLKKLRLHFIANSNPPKTRINYYISGRGGVGKGLASRALARSLFPHITNDDELFFIVGAENATFEGYDGQPVIIWDDCRAFEMLKILKGRGNVFNVLDTHPVKKKQNVKFGSINLINQVNIINSVQSYKEFLDGLAGEYITTSGEKRTKEDKGQAYRRIPFIMNLHEEDFDLLINKGFLENTKDFEEFIEYKNIVGNFQKVRVALEFNEQKAIEIEKQLLQLPKQKFDEIMATQRKTEDEEELLKQFENYGKTKTDIECEQLKLDLESEPRYADYLEECEPDRMKKYREWEARQKGGV